MVYRQFLNNHNVIMNKNGAGLKKPLPVLVITTFFLSWLTTKMFLIVHFDEQKVFNRLFFAAYLKLYSKDW
ncbi:hypothetical protein GLGR_2662 [Leminorella grimontii ATCC 33999 = DSM 5078]|nr:hypothetical protein GLGR_2662 [Leminorella grimontii ATCC 33999 = DSM 5078]